MAKKAENNNSVLSLYSSDDAMAIIQRKSLAVEVATQLQEQILKGDYVLNQQLPVEQKLMDRFGVGRSTIREAVKILVNSGYVRVLQGVGTFIEDNPGMNETMPQRLKRADSVEVEEVRRVLEMKISEKAAMNRTGNDISKMEYFLDKKTKAAAANSPGEYIDAHIEFYRVLADASRNVLLTELFKTFTKQLKSTLLNRYQDTGVFDESSDLYYKLLDSIIRQDPSRAWYWSGKITGQTP
jgi:DNA-binding FadR family transcriptional regulator